MNKIHTINLGGHPYTVDEDAFEYLHAYIRSLRKHFKSSAGCEEIINDIESRLAELLNERLQDKSIVSLREVKEVIAIMGTPEEFGADPIDEKIIDPDRPKKDRSGRRLFRDPDDKIISGVCSGIAAYFGIQDPVWVRLIFGLMIFGGGIGLPLYIILNIIMPKANSAADRLAMKGEPIDYQSIAKKIQDEIEHLSSEFNGPLDPETKKQWNAGLSTAGKGLETGANVLSSIFHFIGNLLQRVIPVLLKIAAVISIIFLCFFIVGLIFGWSVLWPYAPYFIPGIRPMSALAMMNLFFLGLIPLVFVIFLFARMYNGTRLPRSLAAGLGGLWVLNLMGGALFGINTARQFSNDEEITKNIYDGDLKTEILNIELGDKKERSDIFTLFGEAWIEDRRIVLPQVPVHIQVSEDNQFHIYQSNIASGSSSREARARAENLDDVIRMDGNTVYVNNYYELDQNEKMRNQHISIFISVPVGKSVKISDQVYPVDGRKDESKDYPWNMSGKLWTMTKSGLICPELDNQVEKPLGEVGEAVKKALEESTNAVKEVREIIKEENQN